MKKAIALFSTLIVLVLVTMLMSIALKNSTNIKKSQNFDRQLIQENLLINDIKTIFDKKIFAQYNTKSNEQKILILNQLINTPMQFPNRIDGSTITVTIQSSNGKININRLMDFDMQNFRRSFFSALNIMDIPLLEDIINANLKRNNITNESYRIAFMQEDFLEGRIKSLEEFQKIFNLYVQQSYDTEVGSIKWKEYLKFSADEQLDINYMPRVLLNALPISFTKEMMKTLDDKNSVITSLEKLNLISEKKNELSKLKVDLFSNEILTTINIKSINFEVECTFYYNIKNKKISDIRIQRWNY